jgi:CheY-like chemotaxis protein
MRVKEPFKNQTQEPAPPGASNQAQKAPPPRHTDHEPEADNPVQIRSGVGFAGQETFVAALDEIRGAAGADTAVVMGLEDGRLTPRASSASQEDSAQHIGRLIEAARQALGSDEPAGRLDLGVSFPGGSTWIHKQEDQSGLSAFGFWPLKAEGRMLGLLGLAWQKPPDPEPIKGYIDALANVLALALGQAAANESLNDELAGLHSTLTDRDGSETLLRKDKEKFEQAFQKNPYWAVIYSLSSGIILDANQAYLDGMGTTRQRTIGSQAGRRETWSEPRQFRRINKLVAKIGALEGLKVKRIRNDGAELATIMNAELITLGDDQVVLAVFRDNTAHEKLQKEKQELELQLRQSQKMEAIGTLASGIAHDFNNILGAVIGNAEMGLDICRDLPGQRELAEAMQEVLQAGSRAKRLVHQILSFSRQTEHKKKPVLLNAAIAEVLKMLRASLPTSVEITAGIEGDSQVVLADPIQIHQVVINLCTNAAHALQPQGGVLTITLDEIELDQAGTAELEGLAPGKYSLISVRDTGPGIADDLLEKIFQPFFTTKEQGEGTGMGLSVVRDIIHSHGGGIKVESQPGMGSTFKVYLPSLPIQSPQRHEPPSQDTPPLGTERVLFVDDEAPLVRINQRMLRKYGYQVTSCTSSREALELFRSNSDDFDVVITDHTMPHLTGIELARKMLAIRPDIPIVLCTGFSKQVSKDQAESVGIRRFVLKPVLAKDVARIIREVLEEPGRPGRAAAAKPPQAVAQPQTVSLSVLLVDDNKVNLMVTGKLLTKWGHQVISATDGSGAVEAWKQNRFDLILMDLEMPGMDGLEATRRIRELEAQKGIRTMIVAMTGHNEQENLEACTKVGMDLHLTKPFNLGELRHLLEGVAQGKSQADEAS